MRKSPIFTPEQIKAADDAVARYCAELDLTNIDRIVLWLEENTEVTSPIWLAVQISDAFDRAINRKHVSWSAGDPDCPRDIKAGNGELHTLRCKVCGQDIARAGEICFGAPHA